MRWAKVVYTFDALLVLKRQCALVLRHHLDCLPTPIVFAATWLSTKTSPWTFAAQMDQYAEKEGVSGHDAQDILHSVKSDVNTL